MSLRLVLVVKAEQSLSAEGQLLCGAQTRVVLWAVAT